MAELPRGLLDSLNGDVSSLADGARGAFERRFAAMLPGFLDRDGLVPPDRVADLRDAAVELMDEVAGAAAEASCARGAMFYDEARTACAGKALGHSPSPHRRVEHDDDAIRGMIGSVDGTGDPSAFAEACAQRVDYSVRRACGDAVADCGRADPLKPKFARVPAGAETCGFCLMLASRGAVYANELTAGAARHYHANCDCKIVPDFGEGIEGYDQEGMSRRYGLCLDAIGGRDGVRREWDLLPKDKREACIAKHGGKAFEEFLAERVSAEIARRDAGWFMTGNAPDTDYSMCSRDSIGRFSVPDSYERRDLILVRSKSGRMVEPNEWRDLFVHDSLRNNGMAVVVRPSSAISKNGKLLQGVTNPDIEMNGAMWDIKSPRSDKQTIFAGEYDEKKATQFVEDAFRSAIGNFRNPYDRDSMAGIGDKTDETRLVLSLRYRNDGVPFEHIERRARFESKELGIKEVIIMKKDGTIMRIKNG